MVIWEEREGIPDGKRLYGGRRDVKFGVKMPIGDKTGMWASAIFVG